MEPVVPEAHAHGDLRGNFGARTDGQRIDDQLRSREGIHRPQDYFAGGPLISCFAHGQDSAGVEGRPLQGSGAAGEAVRGHLADLLGDPGPRSRDDGRIRAGPLPHTYEKFTVGGLITNPE